MSEMPKKGTFFIAVSNVDRDPQKACMSIYAMLPNSDQHIVQGVCNPLTSYWRSDSVSPFDVDQGWINERKITEISPDEVEQFRHKDLLIKKIVTGAEANLTKSGFLKFAVDESNFSIATHSGHSILGIAKLAKPVHIEQEDGKKIIGTHITNIGELVTDIRNGLKTVNMYDLDVAEIKAVKAHIAEHGFAESIEKKLIKATGAPLKRASESPTLSFA